MKKMERNKKGIDWKSKSDGVTFEMTFQKKNICFTPDLSQEKMITIISFLFQFQSTAMLPKVSIMMRFCGIG